ncbi:COG3014 family protein [Vibrio japonicus]|uniref:Tetratricopeptide repeat protein n=1 Tax=Vibrio japonicus TaxID=1824638 RepID=A0ABY5LHI3_9VIBR|nr:tetratricopeptide repeat protein [Vibrio japonicus]UUM31513.1 tetratricopeptide repeat protein [Vibrio japonicus]
MRQYVKLAFILASSAFLSACSSFSAGNLFSHYSAQNEAVYQAVKSGHYQEADALLPEYVAGDILDNLEKGRVQLLNEQFQQSQASLARGDSAVRELQDKAVISVSESAASISSFAVNDNLSVYQPADYELGFLHLYLGLNYIQQNSLEDALVEMRRANIVQERARKERERELESAQEQLENQGLSPNLGSILSQYPDAGDTLKAVQNGYLLYLSALLYEASGELNSAYVDYRRALAVAPDNTQVIEGTKRVAKRLGMSSDLKQLERRYGKAKTLASNESRVIVLEEQGIVEAMQAWKQSLPLFDSRGLGALYSISLPYYPTAQTQSFLPMTLDQSQLSSDLLTDVNLMAQKNLSERMPAIIIRQAIRVWAKDQLRRQTTEQNGVGNLLFNVWNVMTEQADTRSWLTLPGEIRSSSEVVTAGDHVIEVADKRIQFHVDEGDTVLVWVSRQGNSATIWHKQLGNIR